MIKELIIGSTPLEMTIALLEDGEVVEVFIEREKTRGILGNIYKGRVTKVVPGMQAAFVDIGLGRSAFLFVSDFLEEQFPDVEVGLEPQADAGRVAAEGRGTTSEPLAAGDGRNEVSREGPIRASILPGRISLDPGIGPDSVAMGGGAAGWSPAILPEWLSGFDSPARGAAGSSGDKSNGSAGNSSRRPRNRKRRGGGTASHLSIGKVLQENQEILVQVAKEPIGRKGSRITSHVAFPGRYLVYMPTVSHVGVSRRIVSEEERRRLRRLIRELRRDFSKGGFIVRTVAENRSEEELRRDMEYLTRLWDRIKRKGRRLAAPALVYAEPSLSERVVRDYLSADFRHVYIDDEEEYEKTLEMVRRLSPELVSRIKLYSKDADILQAYGIDVEIEKALRPKVWLKSGGHIVINQTEALVAIDVNTGRYVGKTDSLEDTITRTNLEVVKELVRQIRAAHQPHSAGVLRRNVTGVLLGAALEEPHALRAVRRRRMGEHVSRLARIGPFSKAKHLIIGAAAHRQRLYVGVEIIVAMVVGLAIGQPVDPSLGVGDEAVQAGSDEIGDLAHVEAIRKRGPRDVHRSRSRYCSSSGRRSDTPVATRARCTTNLTKPSMSSGFR